MQPEIFRIIDANCNRIGEGLRVLEDIARFVINDSNLSYELKSIRHNLITIISRYEQDMLSARNAQEDVGAESVIGKEQDLKSLITANSKRVEEALRVMEETAKLPELSRMLNSAEFQKARFSIYHIEQILLSRILRRDKASRLKGLYVILDTEMLQSRDLIQTAEQVIEGGAGVIQLRDKQMSKHDLLAAALDLQRLCHKSGILFIVNDHLDIALAAKADGIHIGKSDMPLSVLRKELPIDKIVGCSIDTIDEAKEAESEGADYIALGSIFPTTTKKDISVVGIERLREVKSSVSIPLVAIGGINRTNISDIITAGVDCAAVISAVLSDNDIQNAVKELVNKFEKEDRLHK